MGSSDGLSLKLGVKISLECLVGISQFLVELGLTGIMQRLELSQILFLLANTSSNHCHFG